LNILTFRIRYPEFATSGDPLAQAALDEAALSVAPAVYGQKFDAAHGALAAHLLWTGVSGVSIRLDGDTKPDEKSRYWEEFARIRREVAPRFSVI
jgi:hypothetical protein